MDTIRSHLLTILILLPMFGGFAVLFARTKQAARWTALGTTLATFCFSLLLLGFFDWTLDVPAGDERVLQSALGVINSLPAELSARVTAISAATEDSVSFRLSKGPLVEWGSAEDSKLKGKVLMALLESKAASKADVIDVSAPTLPITKNN